MYEWKIEAEKLVETKYPYQAGDCMCDQCVNETDKLRAAFIEGYMAGAADWNA